MGRSSLIYMIHPSHIHYNKAHFVNVTEI